MKRVNPGAHHGYSDKELLDNAALLGFICNLVLQHKLPREPRSVSLGQMAVIVRKVDDQFLEIS